MATIYERCDEDVAKTAATLIEKYHPEITEAGVKIDWLFAELEPDDNGDIPEGSPLKLNRYPCMAICRIIPGKQRALGRGDAEICIDKQQWEKLPMPRRRALLDHELEHIVVKRDGFGGIVTDEYDRPKLQVKLHDRQYGWFDNIAERHRVASFEVEQAHKLAEEAGKIYFQREFSFVEAA